jgi:hypothetical protein
MKRQSDTRVQEQNGKVRMPTFSCISSSLLSFPNFNYILFFSPRYFRHVSQKEEGYKAEVSRICSSFNTEEK